MKTFHLIWVGCLGVACGTTANAPDRAAAEVVTEKVPPAPDQPPSAPALDGASKETGYRVTSLAIAAGNNGASIAYARECRGCSDASAGKGSESIATSVRLYEGGSKEGSSPLYEGQATQTGKVAVVSAVRAGELDWLLIQTEDGTVQANAVAAPFVPGGAVISAAVSALRQTPNTSFGTMVRNASSVGNDDGSVQFLLRDRDSATGVVTSISADGKTVAYTPLTPKNADIAALTRAKDHLAVAYRSPTESMVDGPVTVALGGGVPEVLLPLQGVPAALWSNGLDYRVVVKSADSIAVFYDGSTSIVLPRSDEAACTAVAFAPGGALFMLHAGPLSAVLYTVHAGVLSRPQILSERDDARAPTTTTCNLTVGVEVLHAAWVEDDIKIQYQAIDVKTGATYVRSRHDTVKNTINNIR